MNDWERVSNVFSAARLLDGPARVAFLDLACSGDRALRERIESLLAADSIHDDFLEPPGAPAAFAYPEPSLLPPGHVLKDRYEIEGNHGSGGQSVIYRAKDRLLSRPVVIKVLRATPAHNLLLKARFEQEMHALSRIDHPAVVGIHDVGALDDGAPFLVIQYIDGVSVRELLQDGPVDRRRVIRIVRAVGAALSAVHAAGIAHQDLKPENVMVQRLTDGAEAIKLIDFGIAKVDRSDLPNTTTVMIEGSVRYMAPEQFEGRNSKAADVYALGLVACELLCGQPDPRALPPRFGDRVRRHLEMAVAYAPEARPSDVKAWADRLGNLLEEPLAAARSRGARVLGQLLLGLAGIATLGAVMLLRDGRKPALPLSPVADSPIAMWRADGTSEDSVHRNDATTVGPVTYEQGRFGQAFGFHGDGLLRAQPVGLPAGNSDRTIEFWLLLTKTFPTDVPDSAAIWLLGYGNFGERAKAYLIQYSKDAGLAFSNWGTAISTGRTLEAGVWHHIAVTNESNSCSLYLNGEAIGRASFEIDTQPGTPLYIAGLPADVLDRTRKRSKLEWIELNLTGRIDDVRIFRRALRAEEIRAEYATATALR